VKKQGNSCGAKGLALICKGERRHRLNLESEYSMETKLNLISEKASKDKKYKFNNLAYLLNRTNLVNCFFRLKTGKATGVDNVTLEEYEKNLGNNLDDLAERMKRQAYKPQPSRREYIKKMNGKLRPLGIPATEDKIVQMGITCILNSIYENDFLDFSYGFRPKRKCHDAIKRLDNTAMSRPVNHIIDADIKGFFDNVNHDWLMKFLQERITDPNLLRIIKRFLIAGIMEKEEYKETDKGTPQGGIISPILANVYLHYVLDLWIEKVVKRHCRGFVEIIRYADDFVICVQHKDEAEKILKALKLRLGKFNLELAEDKTRIIEFGRYAKEGVNKKGKKKPETFNFLGFTFYCGVNRKGNFKVGVRTERKKFSMKIKEMNKWFKDIRNKGNMKTWWQILCSKLRGHYQYFGISGNYDSIKRFYYLTERFLFKWLNRRSQRKSFNWDKFEEYLKIHKLPTPRIVFNLYYKVVEDF
jgi:RNA-directed DNA polymerase